MEETPKRKTHTSTAVKRRYNEKTYDMVRASLPKDLVARATRRNNNAIKSSLFREAAFFKYFSKTFEKSVDILGIVCYNIDNERAESSKRKDKRK